mgnify:CR=1 FL=1
MFKMFKMFKMLEYFFIKENLFEYLLIFVGYRKIKQTSIDSAFSNSRFKKVLNREIIHNKDTKTVKDVNTSQPRRITRRVYKKTYNRDLSPPRESETSDTTENVIINVRQANKNKIRNDFIHDVKNICSWLYTFLITGALLAKPVYNLIHVIEHPDVKINFYMSYMFFNLIPVTQYILGFIYFQYQHFDNFYIEEQTKKWNGVPYMNIFTIAIAFFSLVVSIFSHFFMKLNIENDGEFPRINSFENGNFIVFYLWVTWIYGNIAVYTNLTTFSLVFYKHCRIIQNYVNKLENNRLLDGLTINNIIQEILSIRHKLEKSISYFKNIFSAFTIMGAIAFGFFLERIKASNYDFFPWHQFIVYVIVQGIFIYVIFKVNKSKRKLTDYIRAPVFVHDFLKRYTAQELDSKFNKEDDMFQMIVINIQEENASTIDWIVLNEIIGEKWTEFPVMGIDVSDGSLIKKGLVVVTLIISLNRLF